MKKLFAVVLVVGIFALLFFCQTPQSENTEYLRIHIRANSNSEIDQSVKYKVKDAVVDYLIPILSTCQTKEQSVETVNANLGNIESVAKNVLQQNGFCYGANAKINNEQFPTRSYGELTLESGFYDALILNLGSGTGDNWWCVVYPPLCFVNGGTSVNTFKSRILEIINSFK